MSGRSENLLVSRHGENLLVSGCSESLLVSRHGENLLSVGVVRTCYQWAC